MGCRDAAAVLMAAPTARAAAALSAMDVGAAARTAACMGSPHAAAAIFTAMFPAAAAAVISKVEPVDVAAAIIYAMAPSSDGKILNILAQSSYSCAKGGRMLTAMDRIGAAEAVAAEAGLNCHSPIPLVSLLSLDQRPFYAMFQGTSNGGRQFLSNRRSNRHIVPSYGKFDRLFTRVFRFEER